MENDWQDTEYSKGAQWEGTTVSQGRCAWAWTGALGVEMEREFGEEFYDS